MYTTYNTTTCPFQMSPSSSYIYYYYKYKCMWQLLLLLLVLKPPQAPQTTATTIIFVWNIFSNRTDVKLSSHILLLECIYVGKCIPNSRNINSIDIAHSTRAVLALVLYIHINARRRSQMSTILYTRHVSLLYVMLSI